METSDGLISTISGSISDVIDEHMTILSAVRELITFSTDEVSYALVKRGLANLLWWWQEEHDCLLREAVENVKRRPDYIIQRATMIEAEISKYSPSDVTDLDEIIEGLEYTLKTFGAHYSNADNLHKTLVAFKSTEKGEKKQ